MRIKHAVIALAVTFTVPACTPEQRAAMRSLGAPVPADGTPEAAIVDALPDRTEQWYEFEITPAGVITEIPQFDSGYGAHIDQWQKLALQAGWAKSELPWLMCTIERESQGNQNAEGIGPRDPGGSLGLMQINSNSWVGALKRADIITSRGDLFNPALNLKAAKWVFTHAGARQWRTSKKNCNKQYGF